MTSEKPIMWGAAIIVLAGIGALYYFYAARGPVQVAPPPHQAQPAAQASSEPAIEHPVPGAAQNTQQPLPPLNESDQPLDSALTSVQGDAALAKFLIPQNLVRHIVATIDNLPRKKVSVELRPIKPVPGQFAVTGTADHLTLSSDNFKRYTPFVDAVKAVDVKQLAAVYFRFYPLFQQAYEDLGYPTEYFNDRVIQVIDHLLETPDVQGPIELKQPNVMYTYADPKLEALSAGQKTLIRMGPENATVIKSKLRELRDLLATHPGPAAGQGSAPQTEPSREAPQTGLAAPPSAPPPASAPPATPPPTATPAPGNTARPAPPPR